MLVAEAHSSVHGARSNLRDTISETLSSEDNMAP